MLMLFARLLTELANEHIHRHPADFGDGLTDYRYGGRIKAKEIVIVKNDHAHILREAQAERTQAFQPVNTQVIGGKKQRIGPWFVLQELADAANRLLPCSIEWDPQEAILANRLPLVLQSVRVATVALLHLHLLLANGDKSNILISLGNQEGHRFMSTSVIVNRHIRRIIVGEIAIDQYQGFFLPDEKFNVLLQFDGGRYDEAVHLPVFKHFEQFTGPCLIVLRAAVHKLVAVFIGFDFDDLCQACKKWIGNVFNHQANGMRFARPQSARDLIGCVIQLPRDLFNSTHQLFADSFFLGLAI